MLCMEQKRYRTFIVYAIIMVIAPSCTRLIVWTLAFLQRMASIFLALSHIYSLGKDVFVQIYLHIYGAHILFLMLIILTILRLVPMKSVCMCSQCVCALRYLFHNCLSA